MTRFLDLCERAARRGGKILLDYRGRITPREKGPKDLVTEADLASQKQIREILLGEFPDHGFLGEEGGGSGDGSGYDRPWYEQQYCWVVDPLDGTTNYVHDLPNYSVSIALCSLGQPIAGCVFDPLLDECFLAAQGEGAQRNGQTIRVSPCEQMREALIAASLPADLPRNSVEISRFIEVMHGAQAIRRLGSAALNLCYVASGRLDGYWATSVAPWDVAAGALILKEAGGTITALDGTEFDLANPRFIASATAALHQEFDAVLARATETRPA